MIGAPGRPIIKPASAIMQTPESNAGDSSRMPVEKREKFCILIRQALLNPVCQSVGKRVFIVLFLCSCVSAGCASSHNIDIKLGDHHLHSLGMESDDGFFDVFKRYIIQLPVTLDTDTVDWGFACL